MTKLWTLAILAGCTPYSTRGTTVPVAPAFGPSEADVATVCVLRSSAFAQAVTFVVHDNQTLVGATKGTSYFCYEAEPGNHTIVSDTFDSTDHAGSTRVALAAGQRYWLQQDHENNFGSVTSKLVWVTEAEARELVDGAEYRMITEAPAHEPLPPSPMAFAPAAYPLAASR
jgi:hypothetical protein